MLFFLFFKQKTAYEVRISDWSSDVCSSDLSALCVRVRLGRRRACDSDTRIVHCRRSPARRLPSRPNLLLSANRQEPARSLVAASRATTRCCGNRGGADTRLSAVSLRKEPTHVAPCPQSRRHKWNAAEGRPLRRRNQEISSSKTLFPDSDRNCKREIARGELYLSAASSQELLRSDARPDAGPYQPPRYAGPPARPPPPHP